MLRYIPLSGRLTLDVSGVLVGAATFFGYVTPILGALASIGAIIWYGLQIYYFLRDRK